jgi:hypothetical protein
LTTLLLNIGVSEHARWEIGDWLDSVGFGDTLFLDSTFFFFFFLVDFGRGRERERGKGDVIDVGSDLVG